MKRLLLFLPLLLLVYSCEKDRPNVSISYFMTVNDSSAYDKVLFHFDWVRAHKGNGIRSVELDSRDVDFSLSLPDTISLGSFGIEPEFVVGYDFSLSGLAVIKGQDTIRPQHPDDARPSFSLARLDLSDGRNRKVIFELNIDESIRLDSAGSDWIRPQITTTAD